MDFDDEAENSQDEAENSQLTHKQGMEYFQQAYNKSVKCYGKKKTSPKEHYIADMLRDIGITRDVDVKAILTLIGKMQKYNAFKQYVMNIMEFPTPKSQMKRKISFLAGQKVKGLVSTIPIEMLNILIVQPVQNPHVQQTMEVMIEEPGNNNSGNAVNDVDNNDEAMDIVPPLVLSLAHSVILYENLLRKLFHSRAAENVNQFKDLYTSRHASKSKQNHLRAALKVVAANNAGSSEKTATKNKKKRKFSEVVPQFINFASPSMRIDDAAMEEEAEAEAEEQEEDSADLDIPEDEDIEWWKSLDDDIDNDIDSQNNENESILCNLASYYNSIVDTVVSTLTTP